MLSGSILIFFLKKVRGKCLKLYSLRCMAIFMRYLRKSDFFVEFSEGTLYNLFCYMATRLVFFK